MARADPCRAARLRQRRRAARPPPRRARRPDRRPGRGGHHRGPRRRPRPRPSAATSSSGPERLHRRRRALSSPTPTSTSSSRSWAGSSRPGRSSPPRSKPASRSSPPTRSSSPTTAPSCSTVAARAGVDLLFEASVAGGIPLMRPLRESLAGDRIRRVTGIVNGTTNYILTRMAEAGATFEEALAEAQRLGYAEPDPTADIEGLDAAAKADDHRHDRVRGPGAARRRPHRGHHRDHQRRHHLGATARLRREAASPSRRKAAATSRSGCTRRWSRSSIHSPPCATPSTRCSSKPKPSGS